MIKRGQAVKATVLHNASVKPQVAQLVRKERAKRGISQSTLAKLLGIKNAGAQNTLSVWERGLYNLFFSSLQKAILAKFLGMGLTELNKLLQQDTAFFANRKTGGKSKRTNGKSKSVPTPRRSRTTSPKSAAKASVTQIKPASGTRIDLAPGTSLPITTSKVSVDANSLPKPSFGLETPDKKVDKKVDSKIKRAESSRRAISPVRLLGALVRNEPTLVTADPEAIFRVVHRLRMVMQIMGFPSSEIDRILRR
jgi:transcriptional regulator with XRE-family HTH domain